MSKKNQKQNAPVAPVTVAPVTPAPVAPVTPAPVAPVTPAVTLGVANPNSKRITAGTALTEYRVVPSQRKSFAGYFVQGGTYRASALNPDRSLFDVCIEIPFATLREAQEKLVALRTPAPVAPAPAPAPVEAKPAAKAAPAKTRAKKVA